MYQDTYMKLDEMTGQYVLTEDALVANGTNLRFKLEYNRSVDASSIIQRHLSRVSDIIYNFIHSYSNNNRRQDDAIKIIPSLRETVFRAMLAQSEYMLLNGDLSRSTDREKRALAVDDNARRLLEQFNPDLGVSILYAGAY